MGISELANKILNLLGMLCQARYSSVYGEFEGERDMYVAATELSILIERVESSMQQG